MPLCRLTLVALAFAVPAVTAEPLTGEQIYRKRCASCHGPAGEGTKKADKPLFGDKTPAALAKIIAKTMPEDDPGSCTGPDADKVATYIHDAFYSKEARERNRPPRIDLARLTVRQYRNTIADVVGGFRGPPVRDDKRGLRGEYFNSRNFQQNQRLVDRTDPEVKFDFDTGTPAEGKIDPKQFAIRWEGSVLPPDTGMYEFVVRTNHATRLWVNDNTKPLVDAWVKSGSDTEFRGEVFLLGGRAYSVRLEFSKAKQGVDDTKKEKERPSTKAFVFLEWKIPGRAQEVIPNRSLSPTKSPEVYVPSVPFPPDDRSLGWERGTTVSKAWDQATTDQALETAAYISSKLNELAGIRDGAPDRDARVRDFCRRFAERAFRRPLTPEWKKLYVDAQFDAVKDTELAVRRSVLMVLKSPRFLYRELINDAHSVAARLSFELWDSVPDAPLLAAAAAGQLTTREQVAKQAERMLADPRAKAKLRDFLLIWLKVDRAAEVSKDAKRFPGFDPALVADLRSSLDLFLDDVLWSEGSDFRRLLLDDTLQLNGKLAKFYGADLSADAPFTKVKLNPEKRAGALTHPFLMTAFAYTAESSPIHRGVFIARGVLGRTLMPPQEAFTPLAPDLHPTLTTRERVLLQTKAEACSSCHSLINPLGFTLENFDAVGRYREKEREKPVDATGAYVTRSGETKTFAGIRELATFLAASEETHTAFTEQLFHHLVQQPVRAYGPQRLAELRGSFVANGFSIRKLAVEIAVSAALPPPDPKPKNPPGK